MSQIVADRELYMSPYCSAGSERWPVGGQLWPIGTPTLSDRRIAARRYSRSPRRKGVTMEEPVRNYLVRGSERRWQIPEEARPSDPASAPYRSRHAPTDTNARWRRARGPG